MIKTSVVAVFSVLLATGGQLLLRSGMVKVGYISTARLKEPTRLVLATITTPEVLMGLCLFGLSAAAWLVVLSRIPLSIAYPFAGLTYVFTSLVARYVLHEPVPPLRWLGVMLVVAGIVFIGFSAADDGKDPTAAGAPISGRG